MPRAAQEFGPQAGLSTLGPRGRCARPPLSQPDTDGAAPPVSCVFTAHGGSATLRPPLARVLAHARARIGLASSSRTYYPPSIVLYPLPSISAT